MERRNFIKSALSGFSLLSPKILFLKTRDKYSTEVPKASLERKRARELGIRIGDQDPGPYNAITDVKGVRVGHTTVIKGKGKGAVRTGVTAILPNNGQIYEENLYASYFNLNGWGEMTGIAPLEKTGRLKTPIFLTGTYNVGIVYDAAVDYLTQSFRDLENYEDIAQPIIAECFDDFLSDTKIRMISKEDVSQAIKNSLPQLLKSTGNAEFRFSLMTPFIFLLAPLCQGMSSTIQKPGDAYQPYTHYRATKDSFYLVQNLHRCHQNKQARVSQYHHDRVCNNLHLAGTLDRRIPDQ